MGPAPTVLGSLPTPASGVPAIVRLLAGRDLHRLLADLRLAHHPSAR